MTYLPPIPVPTLLRAAPVRRRGIWLGLAGALMLSAAGSGLAQDSNSPAFDLIFLDDPAPPEAVSPPPEIFRLPEQADLTPVAPLPDSALLRDPVTPALRDLPPVDPLVRLAALRAPKAPDPQPLEPRLRLLGTDITPPADMPADDLAALSPAELAQEMQTELARLGCYRMRVDGQWGAGSRRALRDYLQRSDQTAEGLEPSPEILRLLRASEGEICPAPVAQAPAPAARARATPPARTAAPAAPAQPSPPAASGGGDRLEGAIRGGFR